MNWQFTRQKIFWHPSASARWQHRERSILFVHHSPVLLFGSSRNMICFHQEIWSSPCPSCKWRVGDWENTQLVNTLQCLHWPSTQSCFNAVCQHYSIPISLLQLFLYYNHINIATISILELFHYDNYFTITTPSLLERHCLFWPLGKGCVMPSQILQLTWLELTS